MTRLTAAALLSVLLSMPACVSQAPRGYPLYPDPELPRRDDEIGTLDAPVAKIDDRDVADKGRTFSLLPGCHTLRLVPSLSEVNSASGMSYVAPLPQRTYSLNVEAGHFYSFDFIVNPFNAPDGSANYGFADHRGNSVAAAHTCDGTPLPASPMVH